MFGVKLQRPTYASALRAVLMATIGFMLVSMVLTPHSGHHAASQWGGIFIICWLTDLGVRAFHSLRSFMLMMVGTILGNVAGMVIYGLVAFAVTPT